MAPPQPLSSSLLLLPALLLQSPVGAGAFEPTTVYLLIRSDVECRATQTDLGETNTAEACADKCLAKSGCQFINYNTFDHKCQMTATSSYSCPEGLRGDHRWDFYQVPPTGGGYATKLELWNIPFVWGVPDLDSLGDPAAEYYVQQVDFWWNFMPSVGKVQFLSLIHI